MNFTPEIVNFIAVSFFLNYFYFPFLFANKEYIFIYSKSLSLAGSMGQPMEDLKNWIISVCITTEQIVHFLGLLNSKVLYKIDYACNLYFQ